MHSLKRLAAAGITLFGIASDSTAAGQDQAVPLASHVISGESLQKLMLKEISQTLSSKNRFSPLPNNIVGGFFSHQEEPVFFMSAHDMYGGSSLEQRMKPGNGFKLLNDAAAIGTAKDEIATIFLGHTRAINILSPRGHRTIALAENIYSGRAYWIGGRWLFSTGGSLFSERSGAEPYALPPESKIIETKDRLIILSLVNESGAPNGDAPVVRLSSYDGTPMAVLASHKLPMRKVDGAIRLQNQDWLVVGNKIVRLDRDLPATPSEADLETALNAAIKQDEAAFTKTLATLTLYPGNALYGLAKMLQGESKPNSEMQQMEQLVTLLQQQANQWEHKPAEQDPAIQKAVAELNASAKKLQDAIQKKQSGEMAYSLTAVAKMLNSGAQYFDGQWIINPQVVYQDGTSSLLLTLWVYDKDASKQRGLFKLTAEGKLQKIASLESMPETSSSAISVVGDEILLLAPGKGLAAIKEGKTTWLDTDPQMAGMSALLGSDNQGHLYFRGSGGKLWVYHRNNPNIEFERIKNIPLCQGATVDASGRIWILVPEPLDANNNPYERQPDTEALREWLQKAETRTIAWEIPPQATAERPRLWLCCIDQDRPYKCLRFSTNEEMVLYPGKNNAVFLFPKRSMAASCILVSDNVAYFAKNLHELAETHTDIVLAAAPEKAVPAIFQEASLLRTGDTLWVYQNQKIEAYEHGKPLSLQRRLTLLNASLQPPCGFIGPLKVDGEQKVLVMTQPETILGIFWATPAADGIKLAKSVDPTDQWIKGCYLERGAHYEGLPVVDFTGGKVYYCNGFDRIWETGGPNLYKPRPDTGQPILITRTGELLVHRISRSYHGYSLFSGNIRRDIDETYLKDIYILQELQDGTLIGKDPQGLVWLKPDSQKGYVTSHELPISPECSAMMFVAETPSHFYLTARQCSRPVLLIIDKKNPLPEPPRSRE